MSALFFIREGFLRLTVSGRLFDVTDWSTGRLGKAAVPDVMVVLLYAATWNFPFCCTPSFRKGLLGVTEHLPQRVAGVPGGSADALLRK